MWNIADFCLIDTMSNQPLPPLFTVHLKVSGLPTVLLKSLSLGLLTYPPSPPARSSNAFCCISSRCPSSWWTVSHIPIFIHRSGSVLTFVCSTRSAIRHGMADGRSRLARGLHVYASNFALGICTSVSLADIPCFYFAVMGIEGIATEIENPFGLDTNDLSVFATPTRSCPGSC